MLCNFVDLFHAKQQNVFFKKHKLQSTHAEHNTASDIILHMIQNLLWSSIILIYTALYSFCTRTQLWRVVHFRTSVNLCMSSRLAWVQSIAAGPQVDSQTHAICTQPRCQVCLWTQAIIWAWRVDWYSREIVWLTTVWKWLWAFFQPCLCTLPKRPLWARQSRENWP